MLEEQGEVHLTYKTNLFPHAEAVGLAEKVNLEIVEKVCFK